MKRRLGGDSLAVGVLAAIGSGYQFAARDSGAWRGATCSVL